MWRGWWWVVNEIGNVVGPQLELLSIFMVMVDTWLTQSELITESNTHTQGMYKQSQYWYVAPINLCAIKSLAIRQLRYMRTIVPHKSQRQANSSSEDIHSCYFRETDKWVILFQGLHTRILPSGAHCNLICHKKLETIKKFVIVKIIVVCVIYTTEFHVLL